MTKSKKEAIEEQNKFKKNPIYALYKAITTTPKDMEQEQLAAGPHKIRVHRAQDNNKPKTDNLR